MKVKKLLSALLSASMIVSSVSVLTANATTSTTSTLSYAVLPQWTAGNVKIVDTNTGNLVKNLEVDKNPNSAVVTLDGQYALVSNRSGNTVSVIGLDTLEVVDTLDVRSSPEAIGLSDDGEKAFVATRYGIDEIDLETLTVTKTTFDKQVNLLTVAGNDIVCFHENDPVYIVDSTTFELKKTLTPEAGFFGLCCSVDGTKVYLGAYDGSNSIKVLDMDTYSLSEIKLDKSYPKLVMDVSADGKYLFATSAKGHLFKINLETNEVEATGTLGANLIYACGVTLDQSKLYCLDFNNSKAYIANTSDLTLDSTIDVTKPFVVGSFMATGRIIKLNNDNAQNTSLPKIEDFKKAMEGKYFFGFDSDCDVACPPYARMFMLAKNKDDNDVIINARGTGSYYFELSNLKVKKSQYEGAAYNVSSPTGDLSLDIICDEEGDITAIHFNEEGIDHSGVCNLVTEENIIDNKQVLAKLADTYAAKVETEEGMVTLACDYSDGEFAIDLFNLTFLAGDKILKISDSQYVVCAKEKDPDPESDTSISVIVLNVENGKVASINYGGMELYVPTPMNVTFDVNFTETLGTTPEMFSINGADIGDYSNNSSEFGYEPENYAFYLGNYQCYGPDGEGAPTQEYPDEKGNVWSTMDGPFTAGKQYGKLVFVNADYATKPVLKFNVNGVKYDALLYNGWYYCLLNLGTLDENGKYVGGDLGTTHKSARRSSGTTVKEITAPTNVENGTVSIDKKSASASQKVTITVTPNEGYVLDKLTVKDTTGKSIELTKVDDTHYTFKMPSLAVTVDASYKAINGENIDEEKVENTAMILTIGKTEANAFGEIVVNDVAPIIVNDRTMLPARFVAENLGAKVEWNGDARVVTITKGETVIVITIDSDKALVNGEEVTLDSPAFIQNDRTYTPIRFVAETLGANVEWKEATQEVIITK